MPKTKGMEFYERQVAYLEANDVYGLIENHYNPDAVLIGFDFTVIGKEALLKHFEGYLKGLGGLKLVSTDRFTETEDCIFFEATMRTSAGEARAFNAMFLKNGKISRHFTGRL